MPYCRDLLPRYPMLQLSPDLPTLPDLEDDSLHALRLQLASSKPLTHFLHLFVMLEDDAS